MASHVCFTRPFLSSCAGVDRARSRRSNASNIWRTRSRFSCEIARPVSRGEGLTNAPCGGPLDQSGSGAAATSCLGLAPLRPRWRRAPNPFRAVSISRSSAFNSRCRVSSKRHLSNGLGLHSGDTLRSLSLYSLPQAGGFKGLGQGLQSGRGNAVGEVIGQSRSSLAFSLAANGL